MVEFLLQQSIRSFHGSLHFRPTGQRRRSTIRTKPDRSAPPFFSESTATEQERARSTAELVGGVRPELPQRRCSRCQPWKARHVTPFHPRLKGKCETVEHWQSYIECPPSEFEQLRVVVTLICTAWVTQYVLLIPQESPGHAISHTSCTPHRSARNNVPQVCTSDVAKASLPPASAQSGLRVEPLKLFCATWDSHAPRRADNMLQQTQRFG